MADTAGPSQSADADTDASPRPARRPPRPPSLLDALLPIVVLIGLLALTIAFFGIDATNGPLQVALFLSAAFAALIAFKNGYTVAAVRDATVGGVTTAMEAIFILLAVGALIGTWNMAGTIPTVVSYGIRLLSPNWFYVATAVICAVVGMVTGSSWTTAGTLGVAFVGMAKVLGLEEPIAAGSVICGAYFGDKMTPLSETTILVRNWSAAASPPPSTSGTWSGPPARRSGSAWCCSSSSG
jgi:Na+:H+ antiporter, NhaC family